MSDVPSTVKNTPNTIAMNPFSGMYVNEYIPNKNTNMPGNAIIHLIIFFVIIITGAVFIL